MPPSTNWLHVSFTTRTILDKPRHDTLSAVLSRVRDEKDMSPLPLLDTSVNSSLQNTTAISDTDALQVLCAWPISGQYGPGSRVLYYVLVAACVLARKAEWLRNACLAAALLFPAVAALHGIVLAALHVDGAVDMDIYGAFQLCAIGILAAPVTVKLSQTYFFDPGRNIIFIWTGLLLAGLLSLTIEFYRTSSVPCSQDSGNPISPDPSQFPYGAMCGLHCVVGDGPYSPMRKGSANNIYVIPAPTRLTFGTATLLAAACCIPAVLQLVTMWNKILEINWKMQFSDHEVNELIKGTNGATVAKMVGINEMIRVFLSVVEVPVFSGLVLAILVLGERNFLSHEVSYETEPLESIGQWAPIVGTGLAALGSGYIWLAAGADAFEREEKNLKRVSMYHCDCQHHEHMQAGDQDAGGQGRNSSERSSGNVIEAISLHGLAIRDGTAQSPTPSSHSVDAARNHQPRRAPTMADAGGRVKVARALTKIGSVLGTARRDMFDLSEFKHGRALDFPEIPGELQRNPGLRQIREVYNQRRDDEGNVTPTLRHQRSRAGSFNGSVVSTLEGRSVTPRSGLPPSNQPPYTVMPVPLPTVTRVSCSSTLPAGTTFESQREAASSSRSPPMEGTQQRDTLQVPLNCHHHSPTRSIAPSSSAISSVAIPGIQGSPSIVVSADPMPESPPQTPVLDSPILPSAPSELPPPR